MQTNNQRVFLEGVYSYKLLEGVFRGCLIKNKNKLKQKIKKNQFLTKINLNEILFNNFKLLGCLL